MSTYTQQNHTAPLAGSGSFFGTIRNIVKAPFTWFAGSEDEFEDAKGKRRRLPVVLEDVYMEDESTPSKPKRQRVDSPDRDTQPYLDPPRSAFAQSRRTSDHSASGTGHDVTRSPRKTLHLASTSNRLPRSRRTVSPAPSRSYLKPQGMTRTMSLDPPSHSSFSSRIQPTATIMDFQSEANRTGNSVPPSRDSSLSPRHIRVRSSLTPQPSGTSFGPVVPPRRERGLDEPPPLTALMSNPMFVKPPAPQKQSAADASPQLTLGTLLDSQRRTRPPTRQSSILFGTGSMTDVSAPGHIWPVNKAEMALHELEVYKTPLLPTRLKGAAAVPDMFMHKEKKHITLMTDDRPAKPRLGTKAKGKERSKKKDRERETVNGTKPYAGEGGMKKWLARRKKEEEEAKEKEEEEAMEDERVEEEKKRKEAEAEKKKLEEELKVPPPPPVPVFEPRASREGPSSSSLRVGRTRVGRNHIDRPVSRRAKFSAAFEDEDDDMEESRTVEQKALEEAAKKAPTFELPAGFTFAKEAIITHDMEQAKEPPISSLPFSLTKPSPAPSTAEIANLDPISAPSVPAPAAVRVAPILPAEAPTAPAAVTPATSVAPTPPGIPNFFASSSVFVKSAAATIPPPIIIPAAEQAKPSEVPVLHAPKPKADDASPSLFGVPPPRPTSVFAKLPDSAPAPPTTEAPLTMPKEVEKTTTTAPLSVTSPFSFEKPSKPVESAPAPVLAQPSGQLPAAKPPPPSNGSSFSFGVPPPGPPTAPAAISTPAVTAAPSEAPKNPFTFGRPSPPAAPTPAPACASAPPAADTTKPLFGTAPSTTPFTFGQRSSTAPVEAKSAATGTSFSFGAPSTTEKKPTTDFAFGPSTTSTAAPAPTTTFSFGTAPSGTTAADVSNKTFAFGTTPVRPVTPPKTEQEVTMDESPARDMVLNGDNKAPPRPSLNFSFNMPSGSALFAQSPATGTSPFSFNGPSATVNPFAKEEKKETKPAVSFGGFGQSSSGFSFGQKPPESPATTTPAPPSFQFTAPSPVAPTSPFPFGAPTSANPFGQPSAASAPSSPSTFNRPSTFAFGTPTATQPPATPFGFGAGSQPASPAAGSTTLPSTSATTGSTAFAFGAGTTAAATPVVGFGAPAAAAPPPGASLFTMGSAPPPAEGGGRRIKGLPRRGARR